MDLNLTPEETGFRDELRAWLAENTPAGWHARLTAEPSMERRFVSLRDWQKRVFEAGWSGISWPKEYGGRGASLIEQVKGNLLAIDDGGWAYAFLARARHYHRSRHVRDSAQHYRAIRAGTAQEVLALTR